MDEPKSVKIIGSDGTEYEPAGYDFTKRGDCYLDLMGNVVIHIAAGERRETRLILRRIPKYHYFGPEGGVQIKLKETGVTRKACPGECYLDVSGAIVFEAKGAPGPTVGEYPILTPVAVITPERE